MPMVKRYVVLEFDIEEGDDEKLEEVLEAVDALGESFFGGIKVTECGDVKPICIEKERDHG